MRYLLSSRALLVAIILIVGVVLLVQNMGIAGPQSPTDISAADSTVATSAPPQVDWSLAGLLLSGAVITLLRPRRRKVVQVTAR